MATINRISGVLIICLLQAGCQTGRENDRRITEEGAITRFDTTGNTIYLTFTGHEYADGGEHIREVLNKQQVLASFFFTGDFYRNPEFAHLIKELRDDGHYLGAHSDEHLLYCSWEDRDSLLVTREEFRSDLLHNYKEMEGFGIRKEDAPYFMPPYEWYNQKIANWTEELGFTLINFSPGTTSNADYTWPGLGAQYRDNATLYHNIMNYEAEHGLSGFILLLHIGVDTRRQEKFYLMLDSLMSELRDRGYDFRSLKVAE